MLASQVFKSGIRVALVAPALVPLLLFVYSAQFSRLFADDYCRIEAGLAHGPLHNVEFWRNSWTGSYSNYFLHGVFAPLDWQIARIMPAVTSLIWLVGLVWLLWRAFGFWGWRQHRLVAAVACAALLLVATIDAFYTKQIFFYYTAHLSYATPMALFTLYLAAVLDAIIRLRSRRSQAAAAVASCVVCFLNAGFAEMVLVGQAIALVVLLGAAYLLVAYPQRRMALLLLSAGLLGTALSGAFMLTAPGVASRATYYSDRLLPPVRDLTELLDLSIARSIAYLSDANAFAGFALVFALGMAAGLIARKPRSADAGPKRAGILAAPLILGLAAQFAFLPLLWAHTSDNAQFFGRFSLPYMTVISCNFGLIICYAALLRWRSRAAALVYADENRLVSVAGLALMAAFALFMGTQLRTIHIRAMFFLYISALVVLANISVQLTSGISQSAAKRRFGVVAACLGLAVLSSIVLPLIAFYVIGFNESRYMGPVILSQLGAGFVWGALVGSALGCRLRDSDARSAKSLALRVLPLLIVVAIGADIVAAQLRWIPDLQTFANEWDARHRHIINESASGARHISIWPLSYNMASEFWNVSHSKALYYEHLCAADYYGVESIEMAQDAQP